MRVFRREEVTAGLYFMMDDAVTQPEAWLHCKFRNTCLDGALCAMIAFRTCRCELVLLMWECGDDN